MLKIRGYGDNLAVNDIRIGDLSPLEHEKIELEKGGKNYKPLENIVVSHVKDSSTLIINPCKCWDLSSSSYRETSTSILSSSDLSTIEALPFTLTVSSTPGIINNNPIDGLPSTFL